MHNIDVSSPIETTRQRPPVWVLLVATGLLLGLAYPPNPVGLLGSIGLVPLLIAVERAPTWKVLFPWTYLSFLIFSALSTWWVGSWQPNADPFLQISCVLLVLIHPLFFVVPILLYRFVRRRAGLFPALAFLPFLWCGGEYIHALGDASYPWLTLGNTQTYNLYYIQFIEFTGIWGASFLLVLHNALFTAMILALSLSTGEQRKIFRVSTLILALSLIIPFIHGFAVMGEARNHVPSRTITAGIVQPNVNPWDKWKQADTTDHIRMNAGLSQLVIDSGLRPDMFLWSENAIPYPITSPEFAPRKEMMYRAIDSLGVPVVTGFPDYREYPRGSEPPSSKMYPRSRRDGGVDTIRYDYYNSSGLFVPGAGLVSAYHKMQLVPFGERIPFVDAVPWLMSMLSWNVGISTWAKGDSVVVLRFTSRDSIDVKIGAVVCFESVYPGLVREFVEKGANLLAVITNDGWYLKTPGPLQHARFAALRAIELRRSVIRSANTGISCVINPYGQIVAETDEDVRTTLTMPVELRDDMTLYARWGDWWPQFSLVVALAFLLHAWWKGRMNNRRLS